MSKVEKIIDEALQEAIKPDKDAYYAATEFFDNVRGEPFESPEDLLKVYGEFLKTILKANPEKVAEDIMNDTFAFAGGISDQLRNFLDFYAYKGDKIVRSGWKY